MTEEELQAQENAPQEASPPQEQAPQSKQEQLQALQSELNQVIESIEGDFAKKCVQYTQDPDIEELFFSDREAFFKKILEYQNEVFTQEIDQRQEKIQNLQGEISLENRLEEIEKAKQEFSAQNPQVDTDELLAFFTTLPEEVQKELESLPSEQIFPMLLELKNQAEGAQEESAQDLPKQVAGSPANVSSVEPQTNLPTQRY